MRATRIALSQLILPFPTFPLLFSSSSSWPFCALRCPESLLSFSPQSLPHLSGTQTQRVPLFAQLLSDSLSVLEEGKEEEMRDEVGNSIEQPCFLFVICL